MRIVRLVECQHCHDRLRIILNPTPTDNVRITVGRHADYWLCWQCPNRECRGNPGRDHGWQHDRDQLGCIQVGAAIQANVPMDRFEDVDPRACSRLVHPSRKPLNEDDLIDIADILRGPHGDRVHTPEFDRALAALYKAMT